MYCSFAYEGLLAKFCNILAIFLSASSSLEATAAYECEGPSGVFGRYTIYQHVRLRGNNSGIDEPQEKESTNQ